MAQVHVVLPTTMGHVQSSPVSELNLLVQGKLSVSVVEVEVRSASFKCVWHLHPPNVFDLHPPELLAIRSSESAIHIKGDELYLVTLSSYPIVFVQHLLF